MKTRFISTYISNAETPYFLCTKHIQCYHFSALPTDVHVFYNSVLHLEVQMLWTYNYFIDHSPHEAVCDIGVFVVTSNMYTPL